MDKKVQEEKEEFKNETENLNNKKSKKRILKIISRFRAIKESDKSLAVQKIVSQATPDFDFFFMMVLSVLMAAFGLLANNETVVIGSMLLAPLMNPVLSLGLGLSMSSTKVISRSSYTLLKAAGIALVASGVVTILLLNNIEIGSGELNSVIMSRTTPSLLYFIVAFLSGIAVTYTTIKPHLSAALSGVAVSVALIPPLTVIGIGLVSLNFSIAAGAALMLLVNIGGIMFASMLSFSLMDVHHKRYLADRVIQEETERVEAEEQEVVEMVEKIK